MKHPDSIRVTVDKSHITVLGERLYAESIELIRELANNAFDADATEVHVEVAPERIVVADDGSGMDYEGLVQYFNIGSPGKRLQSRSKRRANPLLKRLTPDAVVKRMRFGKRAVTCVIDHFGAEGPEVFSEENALYLNADHPLFVRESDAPRAFTMYVARLFAQEIAMMRDPRSPRKAFDLQSRILREAFREDTSEVQGERSQDSPGTESV